MVGGEWKLRNQVGVCWSNHGRGDGKMGRVEWDESEREADESVVQGGAAGTSVEWREAGRRIMAKRVPS